MSCPVFLTETARMAAARPGGLVELDGPEGRHAVTVRRLRPGETVMLTDGAGWQVLGEVRRAQPPDRLSVAVTHTERLPAPDPLLVVVQALAKGERGEAAVASMTEVGVDVIVPWAAERSVVRWDPARRERARGRWQVTAVEAAKQSRRVWLPRVEAVHGTAEVLGLLRDAEAALVLHESASQPLAGAWLPSGGRVVLVVGPEGGISPGELEAFAAAGAAPVRLGQSVLRTSTAGTAAIAVISARSRWA